MMPLVLSLFPGGDVLGMGFEEEGCCVVKGPDVIMGGDIRRFHAPSGVFDGVIGGPPCQTFSALAHLVRANGYEPRFGNLIPEFERVVAEAQPGWFLMENVHGAPLPEVEGYHVHAQLLNNRWIGRPIGEEQNRVRRISFGTRDGRKLHVEYAVFEAPRFYASVLGDSDSGMAYEERARAAVRTDPRPTRREARAVLADARSVPVKIGGSGKVKATAVTVLAGHGPVGRGVGYQANPSIEDACELQGLPRDWTKHMPFTMQGKRSLVGNAVPLPMARALAQAVKRAMDQPHEEACA